MKEICSFLQIISLFLLSVNLEKHKIKKSELKGIFLHKRATEGKAGSSSQGDSASSSKSQALGAAKADSESQSFSNTKVKTRIKTSSNANSKANAASKVKAFAKTNTETKVKTKLQDAKPNVTPSSVIPGKIVTISQTTILPPVITRPTHAYWTESFVTQSPNKAKKTTTVSPYKPSPTLSPNNSSCVPCNTNTCLLPIICPCPCPIITPSTINYCPINCHPIERKCTNCIPESPILYSNDCWDYAQPCISDSWKKNKIQKNQLKNDELIGINSKRFLKAAVAADHHLCSTIGKNILKDGGNAIDAAIATHFCVEIVNCHSTGLGGGGFLISYDKKTGKSFTVDFREKLPYGYKEKSNVTQGTTILVPGVLKGLYTAHQKAGKLPWKELLKPSIDLAKKGFRIHDMLAMAIEKKEDFIMTNLGLRELFAPEGFLLKKGDLLKRPILARTLEKLSKDDCVKEFYEGSIAKQIVIDVKNSGGVMTMKDLKDYQVEIREPLETDIEDLKFLGVKAPASGATVALMLKIMSKFNWKREDLLNKPGLFYHQMVEAMKFAYAPSTFLGDPNYLNKTDEIIDYMMNSQVVENMFRKIDNSSHYVGYYGPVSRNQIKPSDGTSHMSVIGPEGDACSITSSINAYYGSKVVSRKLGFIYNNEISDFAEFWPSVYKYSPDEKIPGKRPLSKVSPLIMIDKQGNVKLVAGAAGGFFIPTALGSSLAHHLFLKEDITTAVFRPRIHCQLFPPSVVIEETFPKLIIPLLQHYNHKYVVNDTYSVSGQAHAIMGVIQAIAIRENGEIEAVCDYRKGGVPDGF